MKVNRWMFGGLLAVAATALWLMLGGPGRPFGIDSGSAGMTLLMLAAWSSLLAIQKLPRSEVDNAISPGEWRAWIGLGFTVAALAYFLQNAQLLISASPLHDPDVRAVGRKLVMMLMVWAVLSAVVHSRWKNEVQEDERDVAIKRRAGDWARGTLTVCVIGFAVTLGLSPGERLSWATPVAIANLLIFSLMFSCLIEYATTAFAYLRDRRAVAGSNP